MLNDFIRISVYCAALTVFVLVALSALKAMRKVLTSPRSRSASMSLHDARRLYRRGKINEAEFERLKELIQEEVARINEGDSRTTQS